ncbi:sporulation protein YunB [Paludifilum halophilum]|nr:sporulation protein YunB [Paludifilum halophilum]
MLRRNRLRGPRKKSYWIILLVTAIISGMVYMLDYQAETVLLKLAKAKVKNISQEAVSTAIGETKTTLGSDLDQLMTLKKVQDGTTEYVDVDPGVQAKLYETASQKIESELRKLEQQDNGIPLGAVFQSSLLSDVGPNVPLQIWPKGSTKIEIVQSMEEKGINMVAVTLYLHVTNEMEILIPANHSDEIKLDYKYPIDSTTLKGDVPDNYYYYNNQGKGKDGTMEGPIPVVPAPESKQNP